MDRRRFINSAGALVVLIAMMGAESPGCERRGGVDTDRPPQDRQVDPKRERVVFITASGDAPYTIIVRAKEQGQAGTDTTGPEPVAGGEYRQTLSYTSGLKIFITVTVYGAPKDVFDCSITDGSNAERRGAAGAVTCVLTTSR